MLSTLRYLLLCLCCVTSSAVAVSFTIDGVESEQAKSNVLAHLQGIQAPLGPDRRFREQVIDSSKEALQVFGFYSAEITVEMEQDVEHWRVTIALGRQTLLTDVDIDIQGPANQEPAMQKVLSALPVKSGQSLDHRHYETAKTQLQNVALSLGYFDFEFSQAQIQVNRQIARAKIVLHAQSGPRYQIGEIRLPQDELGVTLIGQLQPLRQGDEYSVDKLAEFNNLLRETGYFQRVLVRPLVAEAKEGKVPLEINVTHKPRDNFDVGGGVSSDDEGPRFRLKWRRPWVNPYGHSMGAELFASQREQAIAVDYRIPLEDAAKNYATFQIGYQSLDEEDTRSDKMTVAAQRHWEFEEDDWQGISFVRYEREKFTQGSEAEQISNLLIPGITFNRNRSRGGLDANWGDNQMLTVEVAADDLFSDVNLLRITGSSAWLRSIDEHRFLFRFEAGAIVTNDFSKVPSSLRFFTGGDQSVRGFAYRSIAPLDDNQELIGGRYLAVASSEYSYPVADSWRAAVFADVGDASDELGDNLSYGAGVGMIWQSPVGPIRFYLARGKNDIESQFRLHLAMGPLL